MKIIEFHIVKDEAPSKINREDTGAPKTATYGGYLRARISSQCIRSSMRPVLKEHLDGAAATRSQVFIRSLANLLGVALEMPAAIAICSFLEWIFSGIVVKNPLLDDPAARDAVHGPDALDPLKVKVSTAMFLGDDETAFMAKQLKTVWPGLLVASTKAVDEIVALREHARSTAQDATVAPADDKGDKGPGDACEVKEAEAPAPAKKGDKKGDKKPANGKKGVAKKDKEWWGKELKRIMAPVDEITKAAAKDWKPGSSSPEIKLFGRMFASDDSGTKGAFSVEGACHNSHAISTHAVQVEPDYFVAVDDLTKSVNMIGQHEFVSAAFYRYDGIGLAGLSGCDVESTISAYIRAIFDGEPKGGQNTFASHTPPTFVMAVVRDGRPFSLVKAFEAPTQVDARDDLSLSERSVVALDAHWKTLTSKLDHIQPSAFCAVWCLSDREEILTNLKPHVVTGSSEFMQKVAQAAARFAR